jgi:hypothetical protein
VSAFLGDDDDEGVGAFGQADGGVVAGMGGADGGFAGGGKTAACGDDAVFTDDDAAVVEGASRIEDGLEEETGDVAVKSDAAFDILVEALLPLDGDEGASVFGGQAGGVDGEMAVGVAKAFAPFRACGETADGLDDFVDDELGAASFFFSGDLGEKRENEIGGAENTTDLGLEEDDADNGEKLEDVSGDMPDDVQARVVGEEGEYDKYAHDGREGENTRGVSERLQDQIEKKRQKADLTEELGVFG